MEKTEMDILKIAILNEVEGEAFYRLAAQQARSSELRDFFLHLASDEEKHQASLREIYRQLTNEGHCVVILDDAVKSPGIFSLSKTDVPVDNLEISAVSAGILMEKASMDYYQKAAQDAQSSGLKDMCVRLADWELSHLDQLEAIYDYLREAWFEQQGFSAS